MNMNDKYYKELLEQYADIKLKLTMYEQAMEELDDIDVNNIPREVASYADEMYPRILKLLRHKMLPHSIKSIAKKHIPTAARVAAVFVLFIYVGLTVAIASSATVRRYVGYFLIERTDKYSRIEFQVSDITVDVPEGWMADYYVSYIPYGFSIDDAICSPVLNKVTYKDGNENRISLSIGGTCSATNYDTEDSYVSIIELDGISATYSVHENGDKSLVWLKGDEYFVLYTTLPYDELMRIAESMVLIK